MSAPTPAPGDDRPREGYYPDPSIPGYVRYWNGASWVPGTSRPAPTDGVPLAPPAGARPASVPAPAPAPQRSVPLARGAVPPAEETGPHFFDEDPQPPAAPRQVSPAEAQHGSRPEPASAWGADRSRQSGFGGDQDRRVSWGAGQGDPRVPHTAEPGEALVQPDGRSARTDGTTTIPPADTGEDSPRPPASGGTVVFRRPTGGTAAAPGTAGTTGTPDAAGSSGAPGTTASGAAHPGTFGAPGSGTVNSGTGDAATPAGAFGPAGATGGPRVPGPAVPGQPSAPGAARADGGAGPQGPRGSLAPEGATAFRAPAPRTERQGGAQSGGPGAVTPPPTSGQAAASQARQTPAPSVPAQSGGPAASPMSPGAGGGQPSWAQQVHRLAGAGDEGQPVVPWKPPVDDVFQAAARAQAAARPAGLGRRLAARLVDTVVLAGATSVAAVPLGTKALDHVNDKIDAAKQSGETVTVWLLDGTTTTCLGIVLAVLLVFGVLYEVLPTVRWGRTLGKKLCGLQVRDIEGGEPPSFAPALRRWLVYSIPGVLAIGVVGVLWCLFDRPWRQCWHDKAAHTFVAA
ncbi:RDD family protein [Streptomyces sp. NPDC005496]|uniref:RDD family protein n=1 Tax=Streptomyces sp. NPDC005496 TaxID=3364716 RepID=UPI0036B8F105